MYLIIVKLLVVSTLNIIPWYNGYNERDGGGGKVRKKQFQDSANYAQVYFHQNSFFMHQFMYA